MLFSAPQHPLSPLSQKLRLDLLELIFSAPEAHFGGPFSSLDIFIAVYFSKVFAFSPQKTKSTDHFILSAGHLAPALYVTLAAADYFPKSHLKNYASFGSHLQSHASTLTPGVEYSSGSLGQGLSFAAGLALGDSRHHTLCLTSDAEHQEGQIWEAVAFAAKYCLKNLINIIDYNHYQIDGAVKDIMPLGNLTQRYRQLGWSVTSLNGHNFFALIKALSSAQHSSRPVCIIANTIFAKGIPFAQFDYRYHDVKSLSLKQYRQAKTALLKNYQ